MQLLVGTRSTRRESCLLIGHKCHVLLLLIVNSIYDQPVLSRNRAAQGMWNSESVWSVECICTTHTDAHTHMRMYAHTRAHAHTHTYAHIYIYACTHARLHPHTHTVFMERNVCQRGRAKGRRWSVTWAHQLADTAMSSWFMHSVVDVSWWWWW